MKVLQKGLVFICTLFAIFMFQNSTEAADNEIVENANGIKITQEEYQNLIDLGFTNLAIQQMTEDVFNENKNLEIIDRSETTKYYEIKEIPEINSFSKSMESDSEENYVSTELTEEEYFKRIEAQKNEEEGFSTFASKDTTSTSYRRLTTTISRLNTTTARVHSKFIWDIIPKTRSYDVLATNIDSTFTPVSGSNYGQQLWSYTHPINGGFYGDNAKYSSSSSTWSKQSAGYGVRMNLKNNASNLRVTELEGYAYFNIKRSSSVVPRYINAFGIYSHAKKDISSSFSYGLSFGGPSISYSGISSSSFDKISTHAQISY